MKVISIGGTKYLGDPEKGFIKNAWQINSQFGVDKSCILWYVRVRNLKELKTIDIKKCNSITIEDLDVQFVEYYKHLLNMLKIAKEKALLELEGKYLSDVLDGRL